MGDLTGLGGERWRSGPGDWGRRLYGIGGYEGSPRVDALILSRRRTAFLNEALEPWSPKRLARRLRDRTYHNVEHIARRPAVEGGAMRARRTCLVAWFANILSA